jgi:hypothetical protein
VDDEEIARQLTCIEFSIFSLIKPTEFLNQAWNKPSLQHRSPNVLKMIDRFNNVSMVRDFIKVSVQILTFLLQWVASMILKIENLKTRARMFAKAINIAMVRRLVN